MDYATGHMCARCRIRVDQLKDCLGESGIYSPTGRAFTLCEICFDEEDRETLGPRGNDLPERLDMYRANLRAGPLNFRAPVPPLVEPSVSAAPAMSLAEAAECCGQFSRGYSIGGLADSACDNCPLLIERKRDDVLRAARSL